MSPILEAAVARPEFAADYDAYEPAQAQSPGQAITAKRLLDIFGALLALFLCAPVMMVIFLGLGFAGSPIFAQNRVGRGGKLFRCYKFRTMVPGAEQVLGHYLRDNPAAQEEWRLTFKLSDDPRITPIGHFLRKSSLDELPQLFNILKGDMSLVGPRPIVPAEVARYRRRIRAYYTVRPGLTGLWQVSGRNLVSYRRRVAIDALYARRPSLALDLLILAKTVGVVVTGRGAL